MGVRDDAPFWGGFETLTVMDFEEKVERYNEVKETIDALEKEKAELAADLEAALVVADQKRVKIDDDHVFERCNGRSAGKIDGKLLASKGVGADVIASCTIPGKAYTYVQMVDLRKQSKGKPGEVTPTDGQ